MVGVANAAGMSSMVIKGTLDTSNITAGFNKIRSSFDSVKGHVKGLHADFGRMNTEVTGLVKKLSALAAVGITAIVGIASQAPQIAPALAQMQVAFLRISLALGDALAPAFDKLAGWLGDLATWIENNKGTIGAIADKMVEWGGKVIDFLKPGLNWLSGWAKDNPDLFAGIASGLILAPAAIAGAKIIGGVATVIGGIGSAAIAGFTGLFASLSAIVIPAPLVTFVTTLGLLVAAAAGGWTLGNLIGNATACDATNSFMSSDLGAAFAQIPLWIQDLVTGALGALGWDIGDSNMRDQFNTQRASDGFRAAVEASILENRRAMLLAYNDSTGVG